MSEKMKCQYCSNNVTLGDIETGSIMDHLVVIRTKNNHFHVHGPISNKQLMKQFIIMIARESGIELEDDKPTSTKTDYGKSGQ